MYMYSRKKKEPSSDDGSARKKPPPVKPYTSHKSTQHQPVHYEAVKDVVVVPAKGLYVPFTCTHMYVHVCILPSISAYSEDTCMCPISSVLSLGFA